MSRGAPEPDRVVAAFADAWFRHGELRRDSGGAAARLPGAVVMASGLPAAYWNTAVVTDAAAVDPEAVAAWYAARRTDGGARQPWGVAVPPGGRWPGTRFVLTQQLMAVTPRRLEPTTPGGSLSVVAPAALDDVVDADLAAFRGDPDLTRRWLEPVVAAGVRDPSVDVAVAVVEGQVVATAHCLSTRGEAGPTGYLGGVAVVPTARRRGVGTALSGWLVARAFDRGDAFVHLHPTGDAAAAVYRRLGFRERAAVDIRVAG